MKRIFTVILCSTLIITLAACGKSKPKNVQEDKKDVVVEDKKDVKTDEGQKEVKSRDVTIYFSDDQAMYLVGETRTIEKPTPKLIIDELIKGPKNSDSKNGQLYETLPKDTEIIDVQVKENIAYVDFKSSIREKVQGGSAAEGMALFSIVNTLILDKELEITKVQFLVEGQKVESLGGHYNISEPISENMEMIKK